ncbi:1,4-dihydroxy-2-naphthoate polyprenyltransferase [Arcanobacterium haemolyticum]|nr:1,4-dihydroxy-2-naphthoate polyprenyltransferase [Arcanobacterium haemolyticum]
MAHVSDWIEGARPRTLPASLAPVIAGTGIALGMGEAHTLRALLAALVALLFQVGVNYSNDYSDGIRGTDDFRTGPARLTGGGKASPRTVKLAAFIFFGLGCAAGLILVAVSETWWLIGAGALAVVAAWYYTGGKHPYGYMGLGEVFVFVFFGLMATAGTTYTQALSVPTQGWIVACAIGLIACAILMVNNIRDIPTDRESGKMTLAVRLGDRAARAGYAIMMLLPFVLLLPLASSLAPWSFLFFLPAAALALRCCTIVIRPATTGRALIPALRDTGFVELAYAIALFLAYALS